MFPCSVPTRREFEKGASGRGVWQTLCSCLKCKYRGEHPDPKESIPAPKDGIPALEESIPDPRRASWPSREEGAGSQTISQHHGTPAPSGHLLLTPIFT